MAEMKELGPFDLSIPEDCGGTELSMAQQFEVTFELGLFVHMLDS